MTQLSVEKTLSKARHHIKRGEISEAQKFCLSFLKVFPKNIRVQKFLSSLATNKSVHETSNQLVNLYHNGQFKEIIKHSQLFLELYPKESFIWNMNGAANEALEKFDEALNSYNRAISLNPNNHEYQNNIGNVFEKKKDFPKAISYYKKSISIKPDYAEAIFNLGNALKAYGELEEAIKVFDKILSLKPNYVEAYNNLGNIFQDLGRIDEAIEIFLKALTINPDIPEIYSNLGYCFHKKNLIEQAIRALNQSLSFNPNFYQPYLNMGNILTQQGKIVEGIEMYNKALAIKPDFEAVRSQKLHHLANLCDWKSIEEDSLLIPKLGIQKQFVTPWSVLSLEDDPKNHKKRSEIRGKSKFPQKPIPFNISLSNEKKQIRIGYFSSDFYDHATMHLMSKIFALHDRENFEIFAYSYGFNKNDNITENLINSVDVFDDVSQMSDKDIALLARQDEIDIAIDLKGYTQNTRSGILAYRAAPIQINFLGYPGTMGTDFIDYLIADPIIIPQEYKDFYSEEIIYMPHSYQPNDNSRQISKKEITKKDMGLPEVGFIFCSFNNNYKINRAEFDIWMRLLHKIEGSVLWLLKSNKWAEDNLKKEAQNRGIDQNRLIFAEKLSQEEHLARHKLADLFLDTFNVNAHTTASDALWSGLPVVTKLGKGFAARVAGSLLNAVGMPELITENEKDYETLIFDIASNPRKILKLKEKLISNRLSQPLFNSEKYTKYLENGYKKIYQLHVKGYKPQTIYVDSKNN
ncbi:tetratricopeptide repeat protein [Alphaproteobacteria bacterium]|nr:tetratricopeptide repeat protein [Alphaproteobacteria bacterium]